MTDQSSTPPSAVNDLAHRFWEGILELNPTTATFYGDPRYADRLEDPSAEGRAQSRALMERTASEAAAAFCTSFGPRRLVESSVSLIATTNCRRSAVPVRRATMSAERRAL